MIGCFNKPKVIFQGCHISQKSLGTVIASKHSDRNCCLQTSSLHFTNTELNLLKRYIINTTDKKSTTTKSNKQQPKQLISKLHCCNQHLGSAGKASSSHSSPKNICVFGRITAKEWQNYSCNTWKGNLASSTLLLPIK